ncbi:MAG: hypothetical protein A2381_04820 [Bdellovibrionales bacterium RIFOXYB1_FULL_37_110]|nr:MAG: hypothetical protein A2181_01250 [Bdellovibrionales bacterium RIFOXYA1_FULL_38_20]OFZ50507.1 MAG: hypothetical protein A2417_10800 [Bdellovibrionales bacterium RIFOXYC1_FULL_37_79]OFZ60778.1 MAG: hypothetical protein A2381_04820 [Bdellovibrionales bacterium RIFOXYB1_FULL_37_110]OFZ64492.1 MAG: hypothetical protein A2577_08785 [Bdellovibrionales bacterium RIFOXYD1_FULL_36_51]
MLAPLFSLYGKVISFEVSSSRIQDFSFFTVCKEQGISHPIIIEEKGPVVLDCMGTDVNVSEFCQKKFVDDKRLLRGVISSKAKKVMCQFGSEAVLKLSCDKERDKVFCQDSKRGCLQLKNFYAFNLELVHHSLVEEVFNKTNISCYYQVKLSSDEIKSLNKDASD